MNEGKTASGGDDDSVYHSLEEDISDSDDSELLKDPFKYECMTLIERRNHRDEGERLHARSEAVHAPKLWLNLEGTKLRSDASSKVRLCTFCGSSEHAGSACPLAENKMSLEKARSQWFDNGYNVVDVTGDGNCAFYACMDNFSSMFHEARVEEAHRLRTLVRAFVMKYAVRFREIVFDAANLDLERKCEIENKPVKCFDETPKGMEAAWDYWTEHITDRSYWVGDFEISMLGLLGVITVLANWNRQKGQVYVRRIIPKGDGECDEEYFPLNELSTRMSIEGLPDVIPFYNDSNHYLRAERRSTTEWKDNGDDGSEITSAGEEDACTATAAVATAMSGAARDDLDGSSDSDVFLDDLSATVKCRTSVTTDRAVDRSHIAGSIVEAEDGGQFTRATPEATAFAAPKVAVATAPSAADESAPRIQKCAHTLELMRPLSKDAAKEVDRAFNYPEDSIDVVCTLKSGVGGSSVDILGRHTAR